MKNTQIILSFLVLLFLSSSCERKYPMRLGDDYFIDYGRYNDFIVLDKRNTVLIGGQIVAWGMDSVFIIIKQKPRDIIIDSIQIKYPNASANTRNELYEESELYYYWIIDKRKDLIYDGNIKKHTNALEGPFTYKEYWEKREEFQISDSLEIRKMEKGSFDSPIHAFFYKRGL